jgi:hypothetical protein
MTAAILRVRGLVQWQDRLLVGSYLRHTVILLVLLTAVAVAIDTGAWVSRVYQAGGNGPAGLLQVLRFLWLRAIDNGVQAMPVAAMLGFVWTEASYHMSGHRLFDRITGRTEGRATRPVLIAAAMLAIFQTGLDNLARPGAVRTMIDERIAFWTRYVEYRPGRPYWFAVPGANIRASIPSLGAGTFEDVTYFAFAANRPTLVIQAAGMEPVSPSGTEPVSWRFSGAKIRQNASANPLRPLDDIQLAIPIDPGWLPLAWIKPAYQSVSGLAALAAMTDLPLGVPSYRSWQLQRLSGGMSLGLLCIFVVLFFRNRLERMSLPAATTLTLAAGYGGVLALRMLRVIGEHGALPPLAVAFAAPALFAAAIAVAYRRRTRHDLVSK